MLREIKLWMPHAPESPLGFFQVPSQIPCHVSLFGQFPFDERDPPSPDWLCDFSDAQKEIYRLKTEGKPYDRIISLTALSFHKRLSSSLSCSALGFSWAAQS
jgi:hypothetical protein